MSDRGHSTSALDDYICAQNARFTSIQAIIEQLKDPQTNGLSPSSTQARLDYLQSLWSQCGEHHVMIEQTVTKEERLSLPYIAEQQFIGLELQYLDAVGSAKEYLYGPPAAPVSSCSNDNQTSMRVADFARERALAILRMHYLKSCIDGEAALLLRNISVTGDNFNAAWEKLRKRYENQQDFVNSHLSTVFSVKAISCASPVSLRKLVDQVSDAVESLKAYGRPTEYWDDLLVFMVIQKVDRITREAWELNVANMTTTPTFAEVTSFLHKRIRALEASGPFTEKARLKDKYAIDVQMHHSEATSSRCPLCTECHAIYRCKRFILLSKPRRWETAKRLKLCFNCLTNFHPGKTCSSLKRCNSCNKAHHSLLHDRFEPRVAPTSRVTSEVSGTSSAENTENAEPVVDSHLSTNVSRSQVMLATARVRVGSSPHRLITARALLDPGSTHSFILSSLAKALGARTVPVSIPINVIGGKTIDCATRVTAVTIRPLNTDGPTFDIEPIVVDTLTAYIPRLNTSLASRDHVCGLELADSSSNDKTPIHIIIGADLYPYLIREGLRRGLLNEPVAQNTIFGWVLFGKTEPNEIETAPPVHVNHTHAFDELSKSISRFFEVEEVSQSFPPSEEDVRCELHFRRTFSRTFSGRFVVRLPFTQEPPIDIGDTRARAQHQFIALEKRLSRSPKDQESYCNFLREYEDLGHMTRANRVRDIAETVFLSHHPVFKETSTTTKIRVVFNASSPSTNSRTLNDFLMAGPKLQQDLPSLITRWRFHRYVCCGDIEKMFRQILVDERDINYQRILWRYSVSDLLQEYTLRTVTYGMACVPFLANRVLQQLADDDGHRFPLAKPILKTQTYVDDCPFGAADLDSARESRNQLIALLKRGGFELRKWASNCPDLLSDIDSANQGLAIDKTFQPDDSLKILGIMWTPLADTYRFTVHHELLTQVTKRTVMSIISRLFDPLGWLSPFVILAKLFMKSLWLAKLEWDEPLTDELSTRWAVLYDSLPLLNTIHIPRWIGFSRETVTMELHGFCDASTVAYAAVVYVRVISLSNKISTYLITSKTRVSPVKELTVPRLELCGAVLLARLIKEVRSSSEFGNVPTYCWTDASIVLAWLKKQSSHWKTFVANRVALIHELLDGVPWRHIASHSNPADLASRGLSARNLVSSKLWWQGPTWLCKLNSEWPTSTPAAMNAILMETRATIHHATVYKIDPLAFTVQFSSWTRLLRVIARIPSWLPKDIRPYPRQIVPTAQQLEHAERCLLRQLQLQQFPIEIHILQRCSPSPSGLRHFSTENRIPSNSPLKRLNPILDQDGLLRVGGRLSLSNFDYNAKFPYILGNHHIARLLVLHAHQRCLHGRIALTLGTLRAQYWVLQARKYVKTALHHCVICARIRAEIPKQLMGSLPPARIMSPGHPFKECGVDYAGPVTVRMSSGRGIKSHLAYIALFICLATKAVHIEVVSTYSSAAFLASFQRFTSRRGLPATMYSDRGTTFQGAASELRAAFQEALADPTFQTRLSQDRIRWSFIPPAAPHFGGLWEAGVKSMKHHINRILGNHTPTFEELTTLVCRVEACMNSRPLGSLDDDVESLEVLTPGHFLVGRSIIALPAPSVLEIPENRLSRWQLVQKLYESFWRRWSEDYVRSCQHRSKWQDRGTCLKVGQIVLLRNDNLPPMKWNLGRITHCHPGKDGIIRVVTVRTATSEFVRPITKLALLPLSLSNDTA